VDFRGVIYRFVLDPVVRDSASSASPAGMFNDLRFSSSLQLPFPTAANASSPSSGDFHS
jgi:hypothetical protein